MFFFVPHEKVVNKVHPTGDTNNLKVLYLHAILLSTTNRHK